MYWSESSNSFVLAYTANSGQEGNQYGNISVSSYANLMLNSLTSTNVTAANVIISNGLFWSNGSAVTMGSGGGGGSSSITVSQITNGTLSNTVTGVSQINFDTTTGFFVENMGAGEVMVYMGSGYKYIQVAGQSNIVAVGEDTLTFVAGNNISLTTNSTSKALTINSTGGGGVTYNTGSTPPSSGNVAGAQWFDTVSGALFEYQYDGTNYQWVDVSTPITMVPSGSVVTASNVNASNVTVTTGIFWANGAPWYSSLYSNANVAAYLVNGADPTISGINSNITAANNVIATHSTWLANLQANSSLYSNSNVASYLSIANNLTNLTVTGYVSTGTVYGATIGNSGATLTGTLSTASQPNVTTLAGLTSLGATGVTATAQGNLTIAGNLNVTGNINGNITGGVVATPSATTTTNSAGYLGMPINTQSTNYTTTYSDQGGAIYTTSAITVTIAANSSVAYPIGTTLTFIAGASTSIAINSDTMYLVGSSGTTGSRTLAAYGLASAIKVANTTWFISGAGLS
jgi:hypothetical protein